MEHAADQRAWADAVRLAWDAKAASRTWGVDAALESLWRAIERGLLAPR